MTFQGCWKDTFPYDYIYKYKTDIHRLQALTQNSSFANYFLNDKAKTSEKKFEMYMSRTTNKYK